MRALTAELDLSDLAEPPTSESGPQTGQESRSAVAEPELA